MTLQDLKNKIENQRNMKTLKIEIPNGFEIDKENSTFEQIVFKEIKKQLPKTWEDLKEISGYYSNMHSSIIDVEYHEAINGNQNIFATEEQAKASIALAQLSQLRDVYRNGWVPDWSDNKNKFCIIVVENEFLTDCFKRTNKFFSFQDYQTRDLFLENFKDLIEQAKPLMS
jgi:hypothetical protein